MPVIIAPSLRLAVSPFSKPLLSKKSGDGAANLGRGVLLDEVVPSDRDLLLVGPGAAELPLRADQDRPWLGVDEELGDSAGGEPLRGVIHDLRDISRLSVEGNLTRPRERRSPGFTGLQIGAAVDRHLLLGQAPEDAGGG